MPVATTCTEKFILAIFLFQSVTSGSTPLATSSTGRAVLIPMSSFGGKFLSNAILIHHKRPKGRMQNVLPFGLSPPLLSTAWNQLDIVQPASQGVTVAVGREPDKDDFLN